MQPNNPQQFTEKAWQAVTSTLDVAKASQQQQMESEHLLKALLEQDGLATSILTKAGVNLSQFRQELENYIQTAVIGILLIMSVLGPNLAERFRSASRQAAA